MSSNPYGKKSTTKCGISPGDWVRVLRNEVGATSPTGDGMALMPYEGIKVTKIESRSSHARTGVSENVAVYAIARSTSYVPVKDVEKIQDCICARPVMKACGCKCGYGTMMEAIEKEKIKKAAKLQFDFPNLPPIEFTTLDAVATQHEDI